MEKAAADRAPEHEYAQEYAPYTPGKTGQLVEETMSPEEYKRAQRVLRLKLDIQIVPICLLLYFLSFLDRTNIGQAKTFVDEDGNTMVSDLGMTGVHDYQIALTVLYPLYIAFEVPANIVLKKIGPQRWIPTLVVLWGIVSTLQGIVQDKHGLYINRIFLGLAEAGILPGIAVYLTYFYTPREIQLRQALFFTGASLSGAFSGLLAAAITHMHGIGNLAGWRWIFILEGIFTVVVGVICIFILPNSADRAWFLTHTERRIAVERLESHSDRFVPRAELANLGAPTGEGVRPNMDKRWLHDSLSTFVDPLSYLMCAMGFCSAIAVYSIAYFSPTIVKEINSYAPTHAMLMSCPPFAASFVYCTCIAFLSDYFRLRFVTAFPGMVIQLVGCAVVAGSNVGITRYGGVFLVTAGAFSVPPALFAWIANNNGTQYKRATTMALLIVFTNCAGLTSSWLFYDHEGPRYTRGMGVILAHSALGILLVFAVEAYILWERRQRAAGKRDHRVIELYNAGMTPHEIRNYLGDKHPEYMLEM
ncbi:hypothetical protein MCUN1_000371 [Malassezia cuniculi]|uniref:Major facilitator superfamily (MFS) profile domain-containing protein n=1 Tax=Malassezia cuniculi TaxID=948313 RepID=A0AAF0EN27_9BASI|nr:hypothetical protein MCUN1_000371 [Malassezia cuniculi]